MIALKHTDRRRALQAARRLLGRILRWGDPGAEVLMLERAAAD
jgi:hypothetical protein